MPSTVTSATDPWSSAQPYLQQAMAGAQNAYLNPAGFYPGQTYLGPQQGQQNAWDQRLGYANQVFGGQATPKFGNASNALNQNLQGSVPGQLAGGLSNTAQGSIAGSFSNPYGTAGGLDARGAINQELSGRPDYSGLQGAIDAANAPLLRQFNQQILPGLNQRATFLNNGTGGYKALSTILPDLGQRMSENAQGLYNQERTRALSAQQSAAQQVASGGLQSQQNALGLGGLVGNLGGTAGQLSNQSLGLFPSISQLGDYPGQLAQQYGDWQAGFGQQALNDQMARYNYYQQLPQQNASWYFNTLNGTAPYKTTTETTSGGVGGQIASGLGGAIAGSQLGSNLGLPGWGQLGLGALGGVLGGVYGA